MDFKFFFKGIINIITDPVKAWELIDSENRPIKLVRNSFLFPLSILVSVSAFAGSLIFTHSELSPVYSIIVGLNCLVILLLTIYATAFIFNEITSALDLGRDSNISFRIVVYSFTPFLLCQILSRLFESLLFVNIIGFYCLYIFWTGVEKLLTPPQHKKLPMLIATTIAMIGIYIGVDFLLTSLADKVFYAFFA
jgi:hypothetical protein